MNSHNHPALASVGAWLFRWVAGLRLADGSPDAPDFEFYGKGFKKTLFAPGCVTDTRLPSVAARITSVYGPIEASWSKTASTLTMVLSLPPNTCGDVVLPAPVLPESSVITESGKVVWQNGAFVAVGNGVRNGSAATDRIHFAVGSGSYTFLATLTSPPESQATRISLKADDDVAAPQSVHTVGVSWKPFKRDTLENEVHNMTTLLSATELQIYCGLGALANGSYGFVLASHPDRWGQLQLCQPAIETALRGGVKSIQLMVESRADMQGFHAALARGGKNFGKEMFVTISRDYPDVDGVIFDFERGGMSTPVAQLPTPAQFADFLDGVVQSAGGRYSVDVSMDSKGCPYLAEFGALLRAGVRRVRDMGLYHAANVTAWRSDLAASTENVKNGGTAQPLDQLDVGFSLPLKFPWEATADSVAERFAAVRSSNITHVHVFDFQFGKFGAASTLSPVLTTAWTTNLREFGSGEPRTGAG